MYLFPSFTELSGGKHMDFPTEKLNLTDKQAAKLCIKQYTKDMCHNLRSWFSFWPFGRLNCLYNLFDLYDVLLFYFLTRLMCELRTALL